MKYILSISGGKDSVAMLLLVLNKKLKGKMVYPLDEVIFADTGWEYKSIYSVINKVKVICSNNNITFTKLSVNLESMFYKYSWCGGRTRWGTTYKIRAIEAYYKKSYPGETIVEYIGYAKGEEKRIKRSYEKIQIYPLIEQGLTENDCLVKCFKNGIHWLENGNELYDSLDRVSCKFCANKNLKELKALYYELPEYWKELNDKQASTDRPYRKDYTLAELEKKFKEVIDE